MGLLKELKRISMFRKSKVSESAESAADAAMAAKSCQDPAPKIEDERIDGIEDTDGADVAAALPAGFCETDAAAQSPSSPSSPSIKSSKRSPKAQQMAGAAPFDAVIAANAGSPPRNPQEAAGDVDELVAQVGLRFDMTLEEIYDGIGEAYGQMIATSLRSNKWDKRSEALKAMRSVLKGKCVNPDGRLRCWRLSCQLLNHALQEKVMPVRLAAHELFTDTFSKTEGLVSQEELNLAAEKLIVHVFDRLGDSNLRLHESARRCVLFTAEQQNVLGLDTVLARLRGRLQGTKSKGGERVKVFFGVLDTVNFVLQHFPGHNQRAHANDEETAACERPAWSQHDVASFISSGMDDALGPRVRSSAVSLAVTVYQTFGIEATQPILDSLRPAIQVVLKQKFEEADAEGQARDGPRRATTDLSLTSRKSNLGGLVVSGNGVKPPPGHTLPPINHASMLPDLEMDEDRLMDEILEEAGMVFSGADLNFGAGAGFGLGFDLMDEEQLLLEQALREMGMDPEGLDDQQALLSSLQTDSRGRNTLSVEAF